METNKIEELFVAGLLIDCLDGFDVQAFESASNEVCNRNYTERCSAGFLIGEFLRMYKSYIIEHDAEYSEHLENHFRETLPLNYEEIR